MTGAQFEQLINVLSNSNKDIPTWLSLFLGATLSIFGSAERTTIQKNVTPHVFRHTMATLAMENGIELGDLQQLLGHESANTTLRYAQVSESRKQQAHKRFVQ